MTADAAGMSERERLREAMRGNITYASIERGDVDELLDAILAAGFGDVAQAKAAAWDEGWDERALWTGKKMAHELNPYRTPIANGGGE